MVVRRFSAALAVRFLDLGRVSTRRHFRLPRILQRWFCSRAIPVLLCRIGSRFYRLRKKWL